VKLIHQLLGDEMNHLDPQAAPEGAIRAIVPVFSPREFDDMEDPSRTEHAADFLDQLRSRLWIRDAGERRAADDAIGALVRLRESRALVQEQLQFRGFPPAP
jgi:hypothetical protein